MTSFRVMMSCGIAVNLIVMFVNWYYVAFHDSLKNIASVTTSGTVAVLLFIALCTFGREAER